MLNKDIRQSADEILKAHKTLAGISSWKLDPDGLSWRWLANIEIDYELIGATLHVKVCRQSNINNFSITLNYQRCIWRLDFTKSSHLNPLNAPVSPGILIREPHYHTWADNRLQATAKALPKRLRNARLLPESIQDFAPAFRWFLNETNIYAEPADAPDLPKRDTLL